MSSDTPLAQNYDHIEELMDQGKTQEALHHYQEFIQTAEDSYETWANYAAFLYRCGQYQEAADIARKSIDRKPSAEGYHNLGSALRHLGHNQEAIDAYKKALHHNPDFSQTHNDLALCYEQIGQLEHALDHLQIATTLAPQKGNYWLNLASARKNAKRFQEALSATRFALSAFGQYNDAVIRSFVDCFTLYHDYEVTPQLIGNLEECLKSRVANPEKLAGICHKLFLHQDVVKAISQNADGESLDFKKLLNDENLNWAIFNHSLFTTMLQNLTIQDENVEFILTLLRSHCLTQVMNKTIEEELWDKPFIFLSALACQCFINEYIYFETEEEQNQITELEQRIIAAMEEGLPLNLYDLTLFSCYRPLQKLPQAEKILASTQNTPLGSLVTMQIAEPLKEAELKKSIINVTDIGNKVSQQVKEQYEDNPYPRWIHSEKTQSFPFATVLQHLFPYMEEDNFSAINQEKPRTLIAGCGTGKQIIETAQTFENSDIMALDLSASSIGYAQRKCEEYGIKNVEFGIADILNLGELDEQFDVIQCVGVLHHMHNPMAGWKVLKECLKPDGFMLIALYSEAARRSVTAARKLIQSHNFQPDHDGIRMCRKTIKQLPEGDQTKHLTRWMDYYSTSACRDLIFHVQEHHYTPLKIKQSIDDLGLKFLGFHLPNSNIIKSYTKLFPEDPYGLDLENWHKFEQKNPSTFETMYNFWLQK